ncbi:uncharacterized protein LOC141851791 [Brevipalpus obovatus]|uniref:uncharacterized protein LOC141851791 n=1 Tax=Brevipalpus obovatus TaxID=246614 RepID=UPI003D9E4419
MDSNERSSQEVAMSRSGRIRKKTSKILEMERVTRKRPRPPNTPTSSGINNTTATATTTTTVTATTTTTNTTTQQASKESIPSSPPPSSSATPTTTPIIPPQPSRSPSPQPLQIVHDLSPPPRPQSSASQSSHPTQTASSPSPSEINVDGHLSPVSQQQQDIFQPPNSPARSPSTSFLHQSPPRSPSLPPPSQSSATLSPTSPVPLSESEVKTASTTPLTNSPAGKAVATSSSTVGRRRTRRKRTQLNYNERTFSERERRSAQLPSAQSNPPQEAPVEHDLFHLTNPMYIRWLHEADNFREWMNCMCGKKDQTGVIVQCECCLTWQHLMCLGIESDQDLPEVFVCSMCKNPRRVRESCRYYYDSSWLKNGILPAISNLDDEEDMKNLKTHRKNKILTVNLLLDTALEVVNVIHALHFKLRLLERKDADLSLWKESWLQKEPKIPTPPPTVVEEKPDQVTVNCTDFVGLKSTGINVDILDFSKDLLEVTPMEQDKNDVPDDLSKELQELQEGTDLIDFIASSYDEINGVKEMDEPMKLDPSDNDPNQNLDNVNQIVPNIDISNSIFSDKFSTQQLSLQSSLSLPSEAPHIPPLPQLTCEDLKKDLPNGISNYNNNQSDIHEEKSIFPFFPEPNQPLMEDYTTPSSDISFTEPMARDLVSSFHKAASLEPSLSDILEDNKAPNNNGVPLETISDGNNNTMNHSDMEVSQEKSANPIEDDDSQRTEVAELNKSGNDLMSPQVPPPDVSELDETTQEADTCSRTNSQTSITDRCKLSDIDEPQAVLRQNLREHLLDLHERLVERLNFLTEKTSELELDSGLSADAENVEKDAVAFHDLIKELYKDLDIVHRISKCAW